MTIMSLLSSISKQDPAPHVFDDPTSSDEELNTICEILDQCNLLTEGLNLEGYYDISDPFAFILSCTGMLKADDSNNFLQPNLMK